MIFHILSSSFTPVSDDRTISANLYGLAVEAITVAVLSPVSFLYLSYTLDATAV